MPPKPKQRKPNRPRQVTAALAEIICERIAEGETLLTICADSALPSKASVVRALAADPAFRHSFEQARRLQAEHWAEEILEIVDAGAAPRDKREALQRAKLRVEARKWLLARLAAREAGPATADALAESLQDPPQLTDLTEEEREILRTLLERRAGKSPPGA